MTKSPGSMDLWVNHDADSWGGWSDPGNPGFATNPRGCDPIDPAQCMLPYPNDWFTRYDPTSATGRRLDLNVLAMPRNIAGKPIDPQAWNRSDGFSAGAQILTVVPGMTKNSDLVPSGLPPVTDLAMNEQPNLGVILLDANTGKVWPVWVEIDQYTSEAGVASAGTVGSIQQDLMIHPAENLIDGHRYIVALRHLVTDEGTIAKPSAAFLAYREGNAPPSDPRTAHMKGIFADLREAGWSTNELYLAWDFTTASTQNVTGRLLAIRDNAFEQLGETRSDMAAGVITPGSSSPAFTVSSVANYTASQNPNIARRITGTFTVPCYIAPTCSPPVKCQDLSSASPFDDCPSPGEFFYTDPTNPDAVPSQVPGQTYDASFICNVGRTAFDNRALVRPVEFGHGLFGSATQVDGTDNETITNVGGFMECATDWFGFANADVPNAMLALSDLSNFSILTDRTQQGELNFLYLQRLMIHPEGFASNPAFQYPGGKSFIDTSGVYYDGNSQGGIYGGTVCAVSIDVKRCVLNVPGMDYSIMLPRSSDYVATQTLAQLGEQNVAQALASPATYNPTNLTGELGFSNVFDLFYPNQSQRMLVLDLIQTLWDRADPNGYATHMTTSAEEGLLPDCTGLGVVPAAAEAQICPAGTPDHRVLMQMAWGDHQVADITAEDEARTIGAAGIEPELLPSRLCGTNDPGGAYCYDTSSPFWGIPAIASFPYDGSAITVFDAGPAGADKYGTSPPPPSDVPDPILSDGDPHGAPNYSCAAEQQIAGFLSAGGGVTEPPQPNDLTATPPPPPPYFSGGWNGTCQA